jgi:predicted Zn-dependent protease
MRLPSAPMPLSSPAPTPFPLKPPPAKSPAAASAIPAVAALLAEAQTARDAGNLENASALLERALRMQPKYALLWYRLAELRLRQEKPQMAVDLALKSKLLAGSDAALVQQNWALIAQAKHRLGDSAGELEAERQAAGQP